MRRAEALSFLELILFDVRGQSLRSGAAGEETGCGRGTASAHLEANLSLLSLILLVLNLLIPHGLKEIW